MDSQLIACMWDSLTFSLGLILVARNPLFSFLIVSYKYTKFPSSAFICLCCLQWLFGSAIYATRPALVFYYMGSIGQTMAISAITLGPRESFCLKYKYTYFNYFAHPISSHSSAILIPNLRTSVIWPKTNRDFSVPLAQNNVKPHLLYFPGVRQS